MLNLKRRREETILFPELDIEVKVLHCNSRAVRLGVSAPRHITVIRGELLEESETGKEPEHATLVQ